jgi:hypothetical protein
MFREGHAHGGVNVRREWIATDRAALPVAVSDQTRLCLVPGAISDLLFPDLAGMVNRGVSLIVRGLSERISVNSVFHCPSVRRSRSRSTPGGNQDFTTTYSCATEPTPSSQADRTRQIGGYRDRPTLLLISLPPIGLADRDMPSALSMV